MKQIRKFILSAIIIAALVALASCNYNKPQSFIHGKVVAQLSVNDSLSIFNESDSFFTALLTGEPTSFQLAPHNSLELSAKAGVDSDGSLKIMARDGTLDECQLKDFDKGDRTVVTFAFIVIAFSFVFLYRIGNEKKAGMTELIIFEIATKTTKYPVWLNQLVLAVKDLGTNPEMWIENGKWYLSFTIAGPALAAEIDSTIKDWIVRDRKYLSVNEDINCKPTYWNRFFNDLPGLRIQINQTGPIHHDLAANLPYQLPEADEILFVRPFEHLKLHPTPSWNDLKQKLELNLST